MLTRSLLGSAFVLLVAVAATSGGCATGGQVTGAPEGGPPTDAPVMETSSTCKSPQIMCGTECVNPQTDNANCGGCKKPCPLGEVCSDSKCGLTCSPPDTLCSGAPFDGGPMADATSEAAPPTDSGGSGDAGMEDAMPPDAGHHDSGKVDSGKVDAGPLMPYCANINNDPKNCGVCGKQCTGAEMCNAGECVLHCAKGQTTCPGNSGCAGPGECCTDSDCTVIIGESCPTPGGMCACPPSQSVCMSFMTCIPSTSCCTNADCTVMGETCPTPGGTCTCPTGESVCTTSTSSLCITTGTCCTDSDCPVTGETCASPGGTCACPTGDSICMSSNSCISSTACCTAADCPPPPHVMTTDCSAGVCGIMTCVSGWVNVDGTYADGCECQDDVYGKTCATVSDEASVDLGQSVNITGDLPIAGEENWFEFTFPDYTAPTFHAKITLSTNPGNEFLFNVYDPTCASTAMACGDGGNSIARTTWEISETDTNSPIVTFPTVGSAGVVFVEVYRASGAPTCDSYTLTISD
jgi:hypothetical protein